MCREWGTVTDQSHLPHLHHLHHLPHLPHLTHLPHLPHLGKWGKWSMGKWGKWDGGLNWAPPPVAINLFVGSEICFTRRPQNPEHLQGSCCQRPIELLVALLVAMPPKDARMLKSWRRKHHRIAKHYGAVWDLHTSCIHISLYREYSISMCICICICACVCMYIGIYVYTHAYIC